MSAAQLELRICTCEPGRRCRPCSERSRAHWRLVGSARLDRWRDRDPIAWADQRTSLHDCRVALCLAMGVPLEHIHPCTGHNLGRTA